MRNKGGGRERVSRIHVCDRGRIMGKRNEAEWR